MLCRRILKVFLHMSCAFAGIVYPEILHVDDVIELMIAPLQHRSVGEKFVLTHKNIQIGCSGCQLTNNPKRTIYCTIDGRIENIGAIRLELEGLGHTIENKNDLEVLITAYEQWDIQFLNKLNGEFSIVLFDMNTNRVILARDPVGKKPLYWYYDKHYFLFATEIKSLLSSGIVPQTIAPDALSSFLYFGYFPQDLTPIKNVNKLLPAHFLEFSPSYGIQINPYWSYSSYFSNRIHLHKSEITAKLYETLDLAVQNRIPAKGPLGCFLSGGIGSATIAYFLSKLAKDHPLKAFTAGFRGQNEEDLFAARLASESLQIPDQLSYIQSPTFLEEYPKIIWYLDEPLADPNVIATWVLAKQAASFTKTVYSGMGSDELLAGHSRYTLAERDTALVNRVMMIPKPILRYLLIPILKQVNPNLAYHIVKMYRTNPWQFEFLRHNALFEEPVLKEAAPKLAGLFDPETFLHKFHNLSRIQTNVSAFTYFDVKTRLPDCFILQYERLTRAFGLDWQTPFLDRNMLEFAASLPEPESLLETETASYLKPLVQDIFPSEFINRPKKTRKNFLSNWVENPEIFEIMQLLQHGTLIETGFISEAWLREQVQNQEQMRRSFQYLFAILSLEVWFRLFINRTVTATPPTKSLREILLES